MSQSLYQIEDSLQQLVDLREVAEAEGGSETLVVIDQQIREYLTKEAAKVTSYVALIRAREAVVAQCDFEIERLEAIQTAAQAYIDRLKANAFAVMQQFGVKELKATPGGGLRIQQAGGVRALVIEDPDVIPERLKKVVSMPNNGAIRAALQAGEKIPGCRLEERKDTLRVL